MQTVQDYINAARILLQDLVAPYRYSDDQFKLALDIALDDAWRIRPDLFTRNNYTSIVTVPTSTDAPIPRGYQSAFLFYITGWIQLQDTEDTEDARAASFLTKFTAQLLSVSA